MIAFGRALGHVTGYIEGQDRGQFVLMAVAPFAMAGGELMLDMRISRRAALMGSGVIAAWLASPAQALLQAVAQASTPAFVADLIRRMTLEEKAGQLQLM